MIRGLEEKGQLGCMERKSQYRSVSGSGRPARSDMTTLKKKSRNFLRIPVVFLLGKLPERIRTMLTANIKKRMDGQYAETEEQTKKRAEEFLIGEGILIFWGMALLAVIMGSIAAYRFLEPGDLIFERNSFGEGEKEVSVVLEKEDQKREYSLILKEQELSGREENSLRKEFFHELEEQMAGDNTSLQNVRQALCFEEELDGWPFYITYQPAEQGYLQLDGSLGEKSLSLKKGEILHTKVSVTAEYGSYIWNRTFEIQVMKPKTEKKSSPFTKAVDRLKETEKETRGEKTYTVPALAGGVRAGKKQDFSSLSVLMFGAVILVLLLLRNVSELKNGEKMCRKETLRDFPMIVHLLALYMGAGLSFSSAVHRISVDYMSRPDRKKTYAFEEILRMDTCLKLGEGQQEACMQWGKRFKEPVYQKLSLTMLQVMAKGTREGRVLMNHMEQEAFRQRIDQAKKEGEEASTRLLFPMIVLLGMVMLLVMFPAIVRFQGF